VLLSRPIAGGYAARLLSGGTGRPVTGAAVELWHFDWNSGHRREQRVTTDAAGEATLRWSGNGGPRFLLARHGEELALQPDYLYGSLPAAPETRHDTLLYTDRSIYRPGQELR
jgi:hypothetical protein